MSWVKLYRGSPGLGAPPQIHPSVWLSTLLGRGSMDNPTVGLATGYTFGNSTLANAEPTARHPSERERASLARPYPPVTRMGCP